MVIVYHFNIVIYFGNILIILLMQRAPIGENVIYGLGVQIVYTPECPWWSPTFTSVAHKHDEEEELGEQQPTLKPHYASCQSRGHSRPAL